MKKYIGFLILGFLIAPIFAFAQVGDVDPNPPTSTCVVIVNNLRYKDRDVSKNGEVSTLQDFLQSEGYLNSEPTGYLGLLTVKAIKSFQRDSGINPTGYVGPITLSKIKATTCSGSDTSSIERVSDTGVVKNITPTPAPISMPNKVDSIQVVKPLPLPPVTITPTPSGDTTPRIMYWWGKVNQHVDANGNWLTDPDGVSGANLDKLAYCQKWFPNTTSVADYKIEAIGTWMDRGNIQDQNRISAYYTMKMSTKCVQDSIPNDLTLKVVSPNGGETWVVGSKQVIKWQDVIATSVCPVDTTGGATCVTPLPTYYDINLVPYYVPCNEEHCPLPAIHAPYVIAQKTTGNSYGWLVGDVISLGTADTKIPEGAYTIQVCKSGTSVCDSSDSYFKINSTTISTTSYDTLATCIKNSGAVFYGTFWCPHCQATKNLFGSSASLLPYVECSTADGKNQTQTCIDKNIQGYPTWIFADGISLSGEQSLATLASKTSCTLPQ